MLHWRRTRKYLKMCTQPARSLPEYLTDGILLKHLKNKGPTALTWPRIRQFMLLTKCEDSARLVIIASNESSTSCASGASAPIRAFMARAVMYDYGWDIGDIKGKICSMLIPGHHCIEHFRKSNAGETKPQSDGGSSLHPFAHSVAQRASCSKPFNTAKMGLAQHSRNL